DRAHRNTATGALLVGRLLAGPQDLTWSDSATQIVSRVWAVYGGHVDYARSCDWLIVARPQRWLRSLLGAKARRREVRRDLAPIGWYAYRPQRGGVSRVLHVAASEPEAGSVLGELIEHARASGSAAIAGRAEPHLMRSLSDRFAVLGYARTPIIHARDPQLAA